MFYENNRELSAKTLPLKWSEQEESNKADCETRERRNE